MSSFWKNLKCPPFVTGEFAKNFWSSSFFLGGKKLDRSSTMLAVSPQIMFFCNPLNCLTQCQFDKGRDMFEEMSKRHSMISPLERLHCFPKSQKMVSSMIWTVGVLRYHAQGRYFQLLQHFIGFCAMGEVAMLWVECRISFEFHALWMLVGFPVIPKSNVVSRKLESNSLLGCPVTGNWRNAW